MSFILPGDRPAGNIRSTRSPAVGRHGMIATSQSLASAEGLRVLMAGGTAVDAAVTAAGVLAVVEPAMNGPGGDLFALVYDPASGQVHGLDACGASGARCTPAEFERRGLTAMPASGPLPVTVPGVVDGWHRLLTRFGTRSLGDVLEPAIRHARDGFPVQELAAAEWQAARDRLAQDEAAARTFLPDGRAPRHGELFANPRLARSLEQIAREGRDAFYQGALAHAIVADLQSRDGLLDLDDFAAQGASWVEPIRTTYRDCEVVEMPPSTQGFVALEMLNIMEGFDIAALRHNSADYLHVLAEARQIAFADRGAHLADRARMGDGLLPLLISKDYARTRRAEIAMRRTGTYAPAAGGTGTPRDFAGQDHGDTVYLTVVDRQGMVVSFIQSIFAAFGAGIVAGETGITLHNRGSGFTFEAGHVNQVGPRQRPLHTLVPAMLLQQGRPWVSFGVMGGDNQAQAHAQVVANLVDFGMHIQQAGEAARVRHQGTTLAVESGIDPVVRAELDARGHATVDGRGAMGGFQGVMIDPESGVLLGGSDVRKDGLAIGW
jgi:gamma-glutamyltranspeptidase/glutathione hydrolase